MKHKRGLLALVLFLPLMFSSLPAQGVSELDDTLFAEVQAEPPPQPVITAGEDEPDDNGHKLLVKWQYPEEAVSLISNFEIYRSDSPDGEFELRGTAPREMNEYLDIGAAEEDQDDYMANNTDYYYKVVAIGTEGVSTESEIGGPFQTSGQWFHFGRSIILAFVVIFAGFTVYFISVARRGKDLWIRPLAGIEAVDEAIGRATEMGKPTLFVPGIGTAAELPTIAAYTILGRVAKKIAEYQTALIVPNYDPVVMTVCQDVVRSAYLEAGRPDQYSDDQVFFVTNAQFAYVAGVNGIMMRDLPATNFYLGFFAAESLLLAETGSAIGAIQIAGTDQVSQLPFFVVACDYTLIGEELYAASAYLGRDPLLLGALKAQDWGKAGVMILIVLGVLTVLFGWDGLRELLRARL